MSSKWAYAHNEDGWNICDSEDEAIAEGACYCEGKPYYIAKANLIPPPRIKIKPILEQISEDIFEVTDHERADFTLRLKPEVEEVLEGRLNAAYQEWLKEYSIGCDYYEIDGRTIVQIEGADSDE